MTTLNIRLLSLISLLALLSGCATPEGADGAGDGLLLRGMLSPVDDGWFIRLCHAREGVRLRDPQGLLAPLYSARSLLPGRPLFAELEVTEALEVRRPLLLGGDTRACRAELDGIEWRAAGTNPDWEADLAGGVLEIRDQARLRRLRFRVEQEAGRRRWHGSLKAPGVPEQDVVFRLQDAGCEDPGGIWYGMQALMILDGERYRGCARYGDLARRSLPGRYVSEVVADQGPVRSVELTLNGDGSALLSEDYHGRRPATVRTGTWRKMPSGKLLLHLLQRDGRDEQHLRLFSRHLDGTLVLEGEGPEFAPLGLRLVPALKYGAHP